MKSFARSLNTGSELAPVGYLGLYTSFFTSMYVLFHVSGSLSQKQTSQEINSVRLLHSF